MAKRYRVIEEEDNNTAAGLALIVALGVIGMILAFAHIWLSALLGFCGFWIAKTLVDSSPNSSKRYKTGIYLSTIIGLGGLGYWGGRQISDYFNDYMETPPSNTQPSKPSESSSQSQDSPEVAGETPITLTEKYEPTIAEEKVTDNDNTISGASAMKSLPSDNRDDCETWRKSYPQLAERLEPGQQCYRLF